MQLNTTGLTNTANSLVAIIEGLNPVVAAIPAVVSLIESAMSTFSSEDKQKVQDAYAAKMAQTDADHQETQKELGEKAGEKTVSTNDSGMGPKPGA